MTDLYEQIRTAVTERLAKAEVAARIYRESMLGWGDVAEHFRVNDPAFVIRACRADLDRLELHVPKEDDEGIGCVGCGCLGEDVGFAWRYLWPCREVKRLAEVYGIEVA